MPSNGLHDAVRATSRAGGGWYARERMLPTGIAVDEFTGEHVGQIEIDSKTGLVRFAARQPPSLELRAYPIPASHQANFRWYSDPSRKVYAAGCLSDHKSRGYRQVEDVELEFRLRAIGRGQHFAIWWTRSDWSKDKPSELDLLEIVVDDANLPRGILFAFNEIRAAATDKYPQKFLSQTDLAEPFGWHKLSLKREGDHLVWRLDGGEIRRSPWSYWQGVPMAFLMSWEIASNWPGLPLSESPGAQPTDPTKDTPWPCAVEIRNLVIGGRPETWEVFQDPEKSGAAWSAELPFNGLQRRLYGNDDHGVKMGDSYRGFAAAGPVSDKPIVEVLRANGFPTASLHEVIRAVEPEPTPDPEDVTPDELLTRILRDGPGVVNTFARDSAELLTDLQQVLTAAENAQLASKAATTARQKYTEALALLTVKVIEAGDTAEAMKLVAIAIDMLLALETPT